MKSFRFIPQQVGLGVSTVEVGDKDGHFIGVMITVTPPNHVRGNALIEKSTDQPVPRDKVAWYTEQLKREVYNILGKQRGTADPDFISYLKAA